jgi:hypothetical protein
LDPPSSREYRLCVKPALKQYRTRQSTLPSVQQLHFSFSFLTCPLQ